MRKSLQKTAFYFTISAMGVFWAEATSFNIPFALVIGPAYPIYGLLYVLFLDALMRAGENRFAPWYLYGMLVGLITETYVAKVTFHGLSPDAGGFLGFAPGAITFVILFYHAFFSFMAPMYVAKRTLGIPLPLPVGKRLDIACLAAPLLIFPAIAGCVAGRGWQPAGAAAGFIFSAAVLYLWVRGLRSSENLIENVLLTKSG